MTDRDVMCRLDWAGRLRAGAGVAAAGLSVVNWVVMGKIAASWVISPVLGGVIAALFLAFIKKQVLYQKDTITAAKKWVPILVALMAGVFAAYLSVKGLKRIWKPEPWMVGAIGVGFFAVTYAIVKPAIAKRAEGMENTKKAIRNMFHLPSEAALREAFAQRDMNAERTAWLFSYDPMTVDLR